MLPERPCEGCAFITAVGKWENEFRSEGPILSCCQIWQETRTSKFLHETFEPFGTRGYFCITYFAYRRQQELQKAACNFHSALPVWQQRSLAALSSSSFYREKEITGTGIMRLFEDRWFAHSRVMPLTLLLAGLGTQEEYSLRGKIFSKNLPSSCAQLIAGLDPRDLTRREKKTQNKKPKEIPLFVTKSST